MTFDSITADWIGFPLWLAGCPALHPAVTQPGPHTVFSPLYLLPPSPPSSIYPISVYLTRNTMAPSCSHSSISASRFFSPATLSFLLTNHPRCDFLFSCDASLLFSHPSLSLSISPLFSLSCHASVSAWLSFTPLIFFKTHFMAKIM